MPSSVHGCSLDILSPPELELRTKLEHQVRTGFVLRGQALKAIERLRLYRDHFDSFADYCDSEFGFTMPYIKRCVIAAETYHAVAEYLQTNCLNLPKPNKQSQLRPIFQAHLSPVESGLVWVMAVEMSESRVPPQAVVKEAVKAYLEQKYPTINPFSVGEICRITGGVKGKRNCWCVVSQVYETECVVDTWDDELVVKSEHLAIMALSSVEREQILDLGERMTRLYEVGELDDAAKWLLQGLEKLNRAYLTSLESKLLEVIEAEYLGED